MSFCERGMHVREGREGGREGGSEEMEREREHHMTEFLAKEVA